MDKLEKTADKKEGTVATSSWRNMIRIDESVMPPITPEVIEAAKATAQGYSEMKRLARGNTSNGTYEERIQRYEQRRQRVLSTPLP